MSAPAEQIEGWLAEHAFREGPWRCRCGWNPSASGWVNAMKKHRAHVAAILADRLSAQLAATPDWAAQCIEGWADSWDVRPLIEARVRGAGVTALRDAATATLAMTYPTSADPDVWAAWLTERADRLEAETSGFDLEPYEDGSCPHRLPGSCSTHQHRDQKDDR